MSEERPILPHPFPWIMAWCHLLGSFEEYARQEIEKCIRLGAPYTTIYFNNDDKPMIMEDVISRDAQHRLINWGKRNGIPVPEFVLAAWNARTAESDD